MGSKRGRRGAGAAAAAGLAGAALVGAGLSGAVRGQGAAAGAPPAAPAPWGEAGLRAKLLEGYDKAAFPFQAVWAERGETGDDRTGMEVEVGLNFHRVLSVSEVSSEVDLVVWFRQRWNDPRLRWNATQEGVERLYFYVEAGFGANEASEIWTPDIELWNMAETVQTSFTNTLVSVSPDGTVFWSRPGHLRSVCKFTGLDQFPFDELGCRMELGSWAYSGLYVRPVPMDGTGYSEGGSDTAGANFAEFTLSYINCTAHVYPPYPCCPSEDWPVLWYDIKFHRSWQPYVRAFLCVQVVLNALGFSCFWLPAQCGERLGLGITALLASVASDLVVAQKLPTSSEWTWIAKFSLMSISFSAAALFETVIVLYFYYATHEHLCPLVFSLCGRCWRRRPEKGPEELNPSSSPGSQAAFDPSTAVEAHSLDRLNSDTRAAIKSWGRNGSMGGADSGREQFARDADDFKSRRQSKNNAYWQGVAAWVDEFCRWAMPIAYAITLSVMFAGVSIE